MRRALGAAYRAMSTTRDALHKIAWPAAFPLTPRDLARADDGADGLFYAAPRFVHHIDDAAVAALTAYYAGALPPPGASTRLLDICSSWVSHYPASHSAATCARVAGVGMSAAELGANGALSDFSVRDLNADPSLPFDDATFDAVTCALSIDYLTRPLDVVREVRRVLKPGGAFHASFSNRMFPTKVINAWLRADDAGRVRIVGSYVHFAGGFSAPRALDISPGEDGDPLFVVRAERL